MRLSSRCHVFALLVLALVVPAGAGDVIELVNGDVLRGTVVQRTDDLVVVEHETLGRLELPANEVASITTDAELADQAAEEAARELEEAQKAAEEASAWKLALDFSLTATSGNTEETSVRFGATAGRETEATRLAIDSSWFYRQSSSDTTDNKFTLGARHDWFFPESKWFWYAGGRYDYDEFQSWDHRITGQTGPGYKLVETESLEIDLLGGLGFRKEFGSDNDDWKLEGSIGGDLRYTITERQTLEFSLTYFVAMDDFEDYRVVSGATWRYALSDKGDLNLLVGYAWEYNEVISPGNEHYDFRFFTGVQYAF